MKPTGPILVLSVAFNLGGLWYLQGRHQGEVPATETLPSVSSTPATVDRTSETAAEASAEVASPASAGDLRLPPEEWERLMTDDLPGMVELMRAAGVPRNQLYYVINPLVRALYEDEYRAAYQFSDEIPPVTALPGVIAAMSAGNPAQRLAQIAVDNKIVDLTRELLGPDYFSPALLPENREISEQQYGKLSDEKILQLLALNADYSRKQSDIVGANQSTRSPEDRQKIDALDREKRLAIEALLTPEELIQYDMRQSEVASEVRRQLVNFDPSEEEYRQIYEMRKNFEALYPLPVSPTAEETRAHDAQLAQFQQEIAAALPADRGAEYLAVIQTGNRSIGRLVRRLGLPPQAAIDVLDIQRDIEARLAGRGTAVNAADDPAVAALGEEATRRIGAILGPDGLEGFKLGGATWLINITTRSSP